MTMAIIVVDSEDIRDALNKEDDTITTTDTRAHTIGATARH